MIVSPDYHDIMYTHSRFHPQYQHSQNKYLTNLTMFNSYLEKSNTHNTSSNKGSKGTKYASEVILSEGSMVLIPSHFYYSIQDSSSSSSSSSLPSSTWITMRQSTKVSYLSNKLFQAVISEPPFKERATHGTITISIITIVIVTITMTIIIITGVRLASVAYLIRHSLARWNESIKKFLKMMEQRYQNLANNITNNSDDTCNTGNDICMLTHKDSVCTSKDITLGNTRYSFHLFSYTNYYHHVIISIKAKRSGSIIDSYLTDKGNVITIIVIVIIILSYHL